MAKDDGPLELVATAYLAPDRHGEDTPLLELLPATAPGGEAAGVAATARALRADHGEDGGSLTVSRRVHVVVAGGRATLLDRKTAVAEAAVDEPWTRAALRSLYVVVAIGNARAVSPPEGDHVADLLESPRVALLAVKAYDSPKHRRWFQLAPGAFD
ncbi:hypothetical protein OG216_33955 [Streptomycetaceae bacterium NBC_01309]